MSRIESVQGGGSVDRPEPKGNKAKFDQALKDVGIEKTKPTEPKPQGSGGTPPPPSPPPPR
jgi:hypothetical protein